MPIRQKRLQAIIETEYNVIREKPKKDLYRDSLNYDEYERIYRSLGGTLDVIPCGMREYDISTPYFNLELDEEQHYNRFRALTLTSSTVYDRIGNFPMLQYKALCREFEGTCRTDGKYGRSNSSNKQFQRDSLCEPGREEMTRWKQRAFYDFLKDSLSLITRKPLIRISIYEEILYNTQSITIGAILDRDNYMDYKDVLFGLIKS